MTPTASADDSLIIEGIVTTRTDDGRVNVSPMGPRVDRGLTEFVFRPFQTSRTYHNLKRERVGVFQITDDVELLAKSAIGRPECATCDCSERALPRLVDCCRWFAFEVTDIEDVEERTTIRCDVIESGTIRSFFGFNRAKHAVLEAAILATRVHLLEHEFLKSEFHRLKQLIDKTAGAQERRGFELLDRFVAGQTADQK